MNEEDLALLVAWRMETGHINPKQLQSLTAWSKAFNFTSTDEVITYLRERCPTYKRGHTNGVHRARCSVCLVASLQWREAHHGRK